ncbi:hypothetical protein AAFF_G00187410 [Aldrovandia affinis]|uniref:Tumor necrosis factor receptor superfamily member 19L n=1 Tax=Aldrovandia affinis TaxID=143900 RepID=A0AAD7SXU8_9TELE|nr:hypothetical protein AAFF_G00187410 [Aldrovandia affinis]
MGGASVEGRGLVLSDSISDDSLSQTGTVLCRCALIDPSLDSISSATEGASLVLKFWDLMFIEDYLEDDEEPPSLFDSCPSHFTWPARGAHNAVWVGQGPDQRGVCLLAVPRGSGAQQGEDCHTSIFILSNVACGRAEGPEVVVRCQSCPTGAFSDTYDSELCRPQSSCPAMNRHLLSPGTAEKDAVCGDCLNGFYPATEGKSSGFCLRLTPGPLVRVLRNAGQSAPQGTGRGAANATNVRGPEEKSTEYAVFALVPIFCVMGLLGILICNILKKKGYNCTADKEAGDQEAPTPQKEGNPGPYVVDDPNEDTISVLVRLITEKKENAAALEINGVQVSKPPTCFREQEQ